MKMRKSAAAVAPDDGYALKPTERFPFYSIQESAEKIGITTRRLSRLLRLSKTPVHRIGHAIFLDGAAVRAIQTALAKKTFRPGRKKKSARV